MEFQIDFEQIDSWFFKESRPMDSMGNNEMQSLFPPTAYTLSGVLRTLLGSHAGVDWMAYRQGEGRQHQLEEDIDLCQEMGHPRQAGDLGRLKLKGYFPKFESEVLIPAPLNIVEQEERYARMQISEKGYQTDLGQVRLAELPEHLRGAKPLESTWMNVSLFETLLKGDLPQEGEQRVHSKDKLLKEDPRLGIAIEQSRRTAKQGQLYQTSHIRLQKGYSLALYAEFNERLNPEQGFIRFGAEGRQAHAQFQPGELNIAPPRVQGDEKGLIIYFLTHAHFNSQMVPAEMQQRNQDGYHVFEGKLHGVELTIESMIIGKAVREGGWDLAHHKPKPAPQLVPAGSCWYVTTPDIQQAIEVLHLNQLGQETQFGRGLIVCGLWK